MTKHNDSLYKPITEEATPMNVVSSNQLFGIVKKMATFNRSSELNSATNLLDTEKPLQQSSHKKIEPKKSQFHSQFSSALGRQKKPSVVIKSM